MENILELLYEQPGVIHEQDSPFVRTAGLKNENMEMLNATMTNEQKELLDASFDADTRIEGIREFNRFRYAFHLGAQLMAEIIQGKEEFLK